MSRAQFRSKKYKGMYCILEKMQIPDRFPQRLTVKRNL